MHRPPHRLPPPRRAAKLLVAGFALVAVVAARNAFAGEARLWVSAEDAGEVAAVDPAKGEVAFRIKVGPRPRGLKLSRDGKLLYVTVTGSPKPDPHGIVPKITAAARAADGLAVVDVASRKLLRTLPAGQAPIAVDLSPDGKTAYVANAETAELTVVDLPSGKIKKKIPVGQGPSSVAVRPDGKIVYVATAETNEVSAIDAVKLQLVIRIDAGSRPRTVFFARDGGTAFAIDEQIPQVTILDGKKHAMRASFPLVSQARTLFVPQPYAGVLAPDGKVLFLSGGLGQSVLVVDVAKRTLLRTIEKVGQAPRGIGIGRNGKKLYTANGLSNDVSVVDVASGKIDKRISVVGTPFGLVVGPGV